MIPYGRQTITQDDIDAVLSVLRSDFLTQGPAVPSFEATVLSYCGASHSVAMNSATSALHAACAAVGLKDGDLLWTSPITFVASANCARYLGADVDFVDIDPETYCMSPEAVAAKLEAAEKAGRLPKVIVPVHMCGRSCDMASISALAKRYGVFVIEDASHALGGRYEGQPVGCGAHSDITVFSFHPVKIITTCEGGMAVTNNPQFADRMRLFRSHGITRDPAGMSRAVDGPWQYEQLGLGWNYRLSDVQAALGASQMKKLDSFVEARNALASRYDDAFSGFAVSPQVRTAECWSAYHLYVIRLDDASARGRVFEGLRSRGVGVNVHYIPVHTQPYYRALGFGDGLCPQAEDYYSRAITLPLFPTMTGDQQDFVVDALRQELAQ